MAAGAIGLTTAKVGEAEVMAEVANDILIAYPAIDPVRTAHLAHLARHTTVRVAVDSLVGAKPLGEAANRVTTTIGILVDLDVGMGRTGLQSPVRNLANGPVRRRHARPAARRAVLLPWTHQRAGRRPAGGAVGRSPTSSTRRYLWADHGLQARIVSGGSTPTAFQSHLVAEYTEIRPGTYIYNDMNAVRGGYCALDDCAARIICTVVSTAVPGQVVIDAGTKTLTSDLCGPAPDSGHGYIVEYPDRRSSRS